MYESPSQPVNESNSDWLLNPLNPLSYWNPVSTFKTLSDYLKRWSP